MAEIKERSGSFIFIMLVLAMWINCASAAAPTSAQCKQEVELAFSACKSILSGNSPSPQCCERIKVTDIRCVCPLITFKVDADVLNRAIRLVESCGRKVPRHYKCGSITTP